MSMLAERKRKQKWSLNPRGKAWSQDSNKFGQKMLEKMGWQQGKGLGANENGMLEHIKMSYKNDSKGIGYKETDTQWTEHESNFTSLLKSLTGDNHQLEDIKLNSIEQQSQSSKARVHYHKFTRGKDLTRYSEKDLANIFGKKSLKDSKEVSNDKQEDICRETNSSDNDSQSYLVNSGSMNDYFKKKLPKLSISNGYVIGNNGVLKKGDSESEDDFKTFGFGYNQANPNDKEETKPETTFLSYIDNAKKRKLMENHVDNIFSPKKKLKKINKDDIHVGGLTNPAFEPLASHMTFQRNILTTIPECNVEENGDVEEEDIQNVSLKYDKERSTISSKKKSKRKNNSEIFNAIEESEVESEKMNLSNISEINTVVKEKPNKKNKKPNKKKDNSDNLGCEFDNPNFNEDTGPSVTQIDIEQEMNPYEVKPKLKKKKKDKSGLDNMTFSENKSEDIVTNLTEIKDNPFEIKRKSKKKTRNSEMNHHEYTENKYEVKLKKNKAEENFITALDNAYGKIKSKIKKSKKEIRTIDNPSFNPNDSTDIEIVEEQVSTISENTYEVIKPKKNKKFKKGFKALDNPVFNPNDSLENRDINETEIVENPFTKPSKGTYEIVISKKKKKDKRINAMHNPGFNPNDSPKNDIHNVSSSISSQNDSIIVEDELMLNIVSTPVILKRSTEQSTNIQQSLKKSSIKRRKSVRFSDVTQELIIPNNDDLKELEESQNSENSFEYITKGVDNINFDKIKNNLEENVETISNTIDRYQAEIENEINEKKQITLEDLMIGEVGNPDGENEKLSNGTKLKFKYAHFEAKTPYYQQNKVGPKKSYKHLIKGDIIVKFNNSNLHEIQGYALNKNQTKT